VWADAVTCTSSTGGTGALVGTPMPGWPSFVSVFGTGVVRVGYVILEFTDATLATLARAESGLGDFNGTTLTLTRSKILATWNGTTYVNISPAALSFGTTPLNIRILCSPQAGIVPGLSMPFYNTSPSDNLGLPSGHAINLGGTAAMVSANEFYVPYQWLGVGEVIQAAIWVTTAVAATGVKCALYETLTTGLPGRKIVDLASTTPFATTATGAKTATISFWLPPGWYYIGLIANGAPVLKAPTDWLASTAGGSAGATITRFINTAGNYTTGLPATAPTSLTVSTAASPVVFLKPRN
jgi:hypothetical protein